MSVTVTESDFSSVSAVDVSKALREAANGIDEVEGDVNATIERGCSQREQRGSATDRLAQAATLNRADVSGKITSGSDLFSSLPDSHALVFAGCSAHTVSRTEG